MPSGVASNEIERISAAAKGLPTDK